MGSISKTIAEIQKKEKITLPEVFEKYPHLAKLQYEEQLEEQTSLREDKKQLLCD
jgi:hypothetical protein|tara:strand:+ start:1291 stop:1455 length:165 start_codon:yes stop_codon:yes gene_type:complete